MEEINKFYENYYSDYVNNTEMLQIITKCYKLLYLIYDENFGVKRLKVSGMNQEVNLVNDS